MNATTEPVEPPNFLLDCRANLVIEAGDVTVKLAPEHALELIKFIERTGYQAQENSQAKGAQQ